LGDWDRVAQLEQLAADAGFDPKFGPELIPFIEAHARRGDWSHALERTHEAQVLIGEMEPVLCSTWQRLKRLPASDAATVQAAFEMLSCPSL
jgi:hypothetical protein